MGISPKWGAIGGMGQTCMAENGSARINNHVTTHTGPALISMWLSLRPTYLTVPSALNQRSATTLKYLQKLRAATIQTFSRANIAP